jgi:enoyl-CoA hydratase
MSLRAKIGDPHVSVGLAAGDGGAIIWPALVGLSRAKEFLMTGDHLSAEQAERIGLVNHIVAPEALDESVYGFADRLAGGALQSIRWSKVSLNIHLKQVAHAVMDASLAYEALTNRSADHQEAVNAFRERRKPVFRGR